MTITCADVNVMVAGWVLIAIFASGAGLGALLMLLGVLLRRPSVVAVEPVAPYQSHQIGWNGTSYKNGETDPHAEGPGKAASARLFRP